MDKFDQLIKEKIEEKTFEYQPKYWSAFKRYSHIHRMSLLSKIALSAGGILLAGGGLFFALQNRNGQMESPEGNGISAICDTIVDESIPAASIAEPAPAETVSSETASAANSSHGIPIRNQESNEAAEEATIVQEDKSSTPQEKKTAKTKKEYVRGVVITVDSNERGDSDAFPSFNHSTDEIR